jgi:hypothetical protein
MQNSNHYNNHVPHAPQCECVACLREWKELEEFNPGESKLMLDRDEELREYLSQYEDNF